MEAKKQHTSELMKLLDEMKDSKIADDEHEMHTCNLCETIETITSEIYSKMEDAENDMKKQGKLDVASHNRTYDDIRKLVFKIDTLAIIIKERITEYHNVSDIFYFYKKEYGNTNE